MATQQTGLSKQIAASQSHAASARSQSVATILPPLRPDHVRICRVCSNSTAIADLILAEREYLASASAKRICNSAPMARP